MTGLTDAPAVTPDGMVGDFCTHLARTLQNGGNVLVPCSPIGVIYDLLECLPSYLDNMGLQNVPLYFLSPVAETSLAYSNICGEWCDFKWSCLTLKLGSQYVECVMSKDAF
jgi:integrator complex subunit 9